MPAKYTDQATKVFEFAREESRRHGHNFVGTEHLWLGLIREDAGVAAKLLKAMGASIEDAREETLKITGRGAGKTAEELPFTPRAKRVLELAWDESSRLEDGYIDTEHLLFGLLREGDGVGCRILENLAIIMSRLRICVLESCFERHKKSAKEDPKNVTSLGCAGRALYLLERYAEANEYFSAATKLPGGGHYVPAVDSCKQHLKRSRGN